MECKNICQKNLSNLGGNNLKKNLKKIYIYHAKHQSLFSIISRVFCLIFKVGSVNGLKTTWKVWKASTEFAYQLKTCLGGFFYLVSDWGTPFLTSDWENQDNKTFNYIHHHVYFQNIQRKKSKIPSSGSRLTARKVGFGRSGNLRDSKNMFRFLKKGKASNSQLLRFLFNLEKINRVPPPPGIGLS